MTASDNRRQKKIEAQRAKRKDKQRAEARIESSGLMARISAASHWPISGTDISKGFSETGIASVSITRRGPNDQVAAAVFLVDSYCLGVKDIILFIGSEQSWKTRMARRNKSDVGIESISPEAARKLVEGAIAYARSIGFAPHRDWMHASPIFGDIDASKCTMQFTFGLDGKPCFVSGPNDSPERIRTIMNRLSAHLDPSQFHFIIAAQNGGDDLESGAPESMGSGRRSE